MAFKMNGWSGFKKTSPKKQSYYDDLQFESTDRPDYYSAVEQLHDQPRPTSVYDRRGSDAQSNKQRRWQRANLEQNPSDIWSGSDVTGEDGWNQEARGATRSQMEEHFRDNFEKNKRGKLTRKGKRDLKEHLDYIQRRADNPRFSDLKRDRTQNQLTDAMVEQGYSQVQDPKGNWHVISPSGGLSHGGGTGWGEHKDYSMAWRQKMSLNPAFDPSATGDLTIDYTTPPPPPPGPGPTPRPTPRPTPPRKDKGVSFDEAFGKHRKEMMTKHGKDYKKWKNFNWAGDKTGGKVKEFHPFTVGDIKKGADKSKSGKATNVFEDIKEKLEGDNGGSPNKFYKNPLPEIRLRDLGNRNI